MKTIIILFCLSSSFPVIAATNFVDSISLSGTIIPSSGSYIRTNFVSGQLYTNTTGALILISAKVVLTNAAVTGNSLMYLEMLGNETNAIGNNTTASTVAMVYTNMISGVVTNNGTYTFTNRSTGTGNGTGPQGGQIIVY